MEFELGCDNAFGMGTLRSANARWPNSVDRDAIEGGAPPGMAVEFRPGDNAPPNVGVTWPDTPPTSPELTRPPTPPLARLLGACWKFKFAITCKS